MLVRTTPQRPVIFAVRFFDRKIIDARQPQTHQTIFVKFPILVAIRAEPVSGIIVRLVSEAHGNAIAFEGPKLFDQPIVQFFCPLARKKSNDLLPSNYKLGTVSPAGIYSVRQRHSFRITRIPAIFRQANLLNSSFTSKWRQRRTCRPHVFFGGGDWLFLIVHKNLSSMCVLLFLRSLLPLFLRRTKLRRLQIEAAVRHLSSHVPIVPERASRKNSAKRSTFILPSAKYSIAWTNKDSL